MGAIRTQLMGWAAFVALASIAGLAPHSYAQEIVPTGEYSEGNGYDADLHKYTFRFAENKGCY